MPQFIRIGFFLALRQIRRASVWTTSLIVFVMVLTFLNLVVVSGVLVGLIQGSVDANRVYYTSDVILSKLPKKDYIEQTPKILSIVSALPEAAAYTARYIEGGSIQAHYKEAAKTEDIESAASSFVGIDPAAEDGVTHLSKFIVEGEYLKSDDYDQILIGANLLKKYLPIESPGFTTLSDINIGDKVRIKVGGITREMTIKGIIKSKVDELGFRVFFVDSQLRGLIGRDDYNVDEISMKLRPGSDPIAVRDGLIRSGVAEYARVQTFEDAQPKFLQDIKATFALLGNMISSIGLAVASITIFIVIFINAITRRKFIGIMKGIGISGTAIETSYVFQSIFYAVLGSSIGLAVLFGLLQPYIAANPIDFPFSDGILVAPFGETMFRILLLVITTLVAGYIPARMIVRKNTLDSILGRN
ncbi:MAG: FtsX-like permease family protein [Candidatus Paceibacterota bacterium]|jgi:ABC-type lipoprotein release transport system permease subunit